MIRFVYAASYYNRPFFFFFALGANRVKISKKEKSG